MKTCLLPIAVLATTLVFLACSNPASSGAANPNPPSTTVPVFDPRIAMSLQVDAVDSNLTIPAFYQGGIFTLLDTGSRTNGRTTGMYCGQDVYVTGYILNGTDTSTQLPVFWKNGILNYLPIPDGGTFGSANQIALDPNGHVIIAGYGDQSKTHTPGYWKDGVWQVLNSTVGGVTAIDGQALTSIHFIGNDFYMTGHLNLSGKVTPIYWKNGVPFILPLGSSDAGTDVTGMAILQDSKIHYTGNVVNTPVYWDETGTITVLPISPFGNGFTWGFAILGSDSYSFGMVGTWANPIPAYWKNSVLRLPPLPPGMTNGNTNWIGKIGDDLYMDGVAYNSTNLRGVLFYWKNDVPVIIPIPAQYYGVKSENCWF